MKKSLLITKILLALTIILFVSASAISQTAGTLTFNITTTFTNGSWGNKANFVCWIENANGDFIKTRVKRGNELDHLIQWHTKTPSYNTVDATTGATTTTNPYTYTGVVWLGNDITGSSPYNLLPDGDYVVAMELAWKSSMTLGSGRQIYSATFTKGPATQTVTPADEVNFINMTFDWVPAPPMSISVSPLTVNSFCGESGVSISYVNGSGTIFNNNIWTAELSDYTGDFSSPLAIGTLNGAGSGVISANIPSGLASGSAYRVRVTASQPESISSDNGSDISISTAPVAPIVNANANTLHSDAPVGNQWYNENGIINGSTEQDYTATTNGNYYVIVTMDGCSSQPSNIIQITTFGIESIANSDLFTIYPNPVSDKMVIELKGNNQKIDFKIYNSSGQIVHNGSIVEKAIVKTSDLEAGTYFVQFTDGQTTETKKIVLNSK